MAQTLATALEAKRSIVSSVAIVVPQALQLRDFTARFVNKRPNSTEYPLVYQSIKLVKTAKKKISCAHANI